MKKSLISQVNMCSSQYLVIVFVIFISINFVYTHPPCGLYGAPPCQFVPAPPGHTPSCARPGNTYCEHVDNYPTYVIKHLVHKWGYEAKNLIIDETWDEFNSNKIRPTDSHNYNYDHAAIFAPPNHLGYNYETPGNGYNGNTNTNGYPQPIFIPKPAVKETKYLIYNSPGNNQQYRPKPNIGLNYGPKVTQYEPTAWLKRYVRDLSQQNDEKSTTPAFETLKLNSNGTKVENSRDVSINLGLIEVLGIENNDGHGRTKRQSTGRTTLCETTSSFIQPQAALNSKGNWMYVVNEPNTARQLVKAERCASTQCSNLCQLPNGYDSRCEQKFVQKRLVALNSNGQNLYTDTFWFPSCCVCTINEF